VISRQPQNHGVRGIGLLSAPPFPRDLRARDSGAEVPARHTAESANRIRPSEGKTRQCIDFFDVSLPGLDIQVTE